MVAEELMPLDVELYEEYRQVETELEQALKELEAAKKAANIDVAYVTSLQHHISQLEILQEILDPAVKSAAFDIMGHGDPVDYIMGVYGRLHVGDTHLGKIMLLSLASQSAISTDGIQPKLTGMSGKGKTHAAKAMYHLIPKYELIEVIPILGTDITRYREEVHDRIVLNAVNLLRSKDFTLEDLNIKINEIFEIKYPKERLFHHLDNIFGDDIKYIGGRIQITKEIPPIINNIIDIIEDSFKEFIESMKAEYNPVHYQRYRDTFYELIYETCRILLGSMDILKLNMDVIDFKSNNEQFSEIIQSHNIRNVPKFLDIYYRYLSSYYKYKDELILSIFQYAISIDVLQRGSELYTASRKYDEKGILIIDTNIMTSLILKSNRFHETVESMISLSNNLGFRIVYTKETQQEFERLIEAANYNVTKRKSFSEHDKDNELVFDYLKDDSVKNWSDKLTYYNSFKFILEKYYKITIKEEQEIEYDTDLLEFFREIYRISMMTHKERLPQAIEHDIALLNLMYHIKSKDSIKMFESPWLITLDNLLIYVSDYTTRKKSSNCNYCIHAQKWFDILIPFCDIADIRTNQNNFVSAILKYSIIPYNNKLTIKDYTKLLANKFGLEGADSDVILNIISKSRYQFQLEASLERNNLSDTKDITYEIFSDDNLIDELLRKKEDIQTIERLKESIRKSRSESELVKIERDIYKNLLLNGPSNAEIYQKIEKLQEQIEKIDPDFFNIFSVKKMNEKELQGANASQYLEKLSDFIEKRSKDVKNLISLKPYVVVFYEVLKGFLP